MSTEAELISQAMSLLAKRPRTWSEARQKAVEKAARAKRPGRKKEKSDGPPSKHL